MNQDTTTTSCAADLRTAAQAVVDRWDTPLWKDVPATAEYIGRLRAALAAGQATAAQAVVQDDLITIRKPTTSAELLWLLKLAHLVISDVDKTLEETFAPAQPTAQQGAGSVPAPAPPPECETEAEKRAFAFGWFKALESERMKADNKKKGPL